MGIWSWLTGSDEGKPSRPTVDTMPELVLLLEEPIMAGVKFVQGAVEHALNVSLPAGEPNSTEFVTGEFPIFFFQTDGKLLQIKFMPHTYFDPQVRPFVNGDPALLLRKVQKDPDLQAAVDAHKAWVSVSFMNAKGNKDPYSYVARMIWAFAIADVAAIVWPIRNEIRPWNADMLDVLETGAHAVLFEV